MVYVSFECKGGGSQASQNFFFFFQKWTQLILLVLNGECLELSIQLQSSISIVVVLLVAVLYQLSSFMLYYNIHVK